MRSHFIAAIVGVSILSPSAHAAWTATILHPAGTTQSTAIGAFGNNQVGWATIADRTRASLWSGTAGTWVNLHPAGAFQSAAVAMDGTIQGGYIVNGTARRAGIWSGTAASFVNLHPATVARSEITDVYANVQVGTTTATTNTNAALWTGSVASWTNLNPAGSTYSAALGVHGATQVGYFSGPNQKACLWTGEAESVVDLHPDGYAISGCAAVTSNRQGGFAMMGTQLRAALWSGSSSSFVDMHPAGDYDHSSISGMTESLQVGNTRTDFLYRACYWNGTADSFVDLHGTLPAEYTQSFATGVSTDGIKDYIVGTATNGSGEQFAVVWTRPTEPGFAFSLNKVTVAGQNSVQGTITLDVPNAANLVFTTFDNSSLVQTPATVTVPANALLKNFQITVTAVNSSINTTIYARRMSVTRSRPLTLAPLVPTALAFTPNPVVGGQTTSCRVVINGVAGPGGRTIAIFDNSIYSQVPSTVVVPAGATEVVFPITTIAVTSQKVVTVTARVSAGEKTGTFRINP